MAKAKIKKKSTRIDMTAMCDVSFLLLSFFIMTSTAKLPEAYPVDTPASTVQTKVPDTNLATITVGDEKVFFGVIGRDVRKLTLEKMASKYRVEFSEEEYERFSLIDGFGVDLGALKQLIAMDNVDRGRPDVQQGIPIDSANNQLKDWVYFARIAVKELNNLDLDIAIKGDAEIQYPTVKRVMDILQDQKKNKFFLITTLRSDDF